MLRNRPLVGKTVIRPVKQLESSGCLAKSWHYLRQTGRPPRSRRRERWSVTHFSMSVRRHLGFRLPSESSLRRMAIGNPGASGTCMGTM